MVLHLCISTYKYAYIKTGWEMLQLLYSSVHMAKRSKSQISDSRLVVSMLIQTTNLDVLSPFLQFLICPGESSSIQHMLNSPSI